MWRQWMDEMFRSLLAHGLYTTAQGGGADGDPDGSGGSGSSGDGAAGQASGSGAGAAGSSDDPAGGSGQGGRSFTQEELNRIVGETKKKLRGELQTKVAEIKRLQEVGEQTEQSRQELNQKIEELNNELMTADERRRREIEAERAKATEELKKAQGMAAQWEGRFKTRTINEAILKAVGPYAHQPAHFIPLVSSNAEIEPVLGPDGKETGDYAVKVKTTQKIDDKIHEVSVTLDEYLEQLRKDQSFDYMWKSKRVGGTGGGVPASGAAAGAGSAGPMSSKEKIEEGLRQRQTS